MSSVGDKLLIGFDAPRNTVLYLCRKLKEKILLHAGRKTLQIVAHLDSMALIKAPRERIDYVVAYELCDLQIP